jgi:hypothetical protein
MAQIVARPKPLHMPPLIFWRVDPRGPAQRNVSITLATRDEKAPFPLRPFAFPNQRQIATASSSWELIVYQTAWIVAGFYRLTN